LVNFPPSKLAVRALPSARVRFRLPYVKSRLYTAKVPVTAELESVPLLDRSPEIAMLVSGMQAAAS
jgi:hypothetical protein